ncbi:hypothetical protein GCM10023189_12640 [Nibrella saemangeumensis]|uniref:Uncharacterized protein n=1 Tax=Nibrella saemangeumensis TaxID=1084526 RepID=A0ABP8MLV7_9BACT
MFDTTVPDVPVVDVPDVKVVEMGFLPPAALMVAVYVDDVTIGVVSSSSSLLQATKITDISNTGTNNEKRAFITFRDWIT